MSLAWSPRCPGGGAADSTGGRGGIGIPAALFGGVGTRWLRLRGSVQRHGDSRTQYCTSACL
jgi:hypothetical protein